MSLSLVLLNDTLRWHDNPLLQSATGRKAAVVVLDKAAFFGRQYGIRRANLQRLQQQLALITALEQSLARHNIGMITLFGDTAHCIRSLAGHLNATELYCAEPVSPYEYTAIYQLSDTLNVNQLDCNSLLGAELRPESANLPDSFTPFRKQREPLLLVSPPIAAGNSDNNWLTPEQAHAYNSDFAGLLRQFGAAAQPLCHEQSALAHLQRYIWQQQHILHYKQTRNQLHGENYASFCSSALALGCLSVRELWHNIVQFEHSVEANESTYWLKFELLWREFFRWQFRKYGARWFSRNAIKGQPDYTLAALSARQRERFQLWCSANTGVAFIDANMRLLNQTGLMSNRGRQNVASFLIHDLGIDWRLGAAYFEQRLLDYDCASNWGNWAYIAGTGNSNERQFNIDKQAKIYDADGSFVRAMLQVTP